MYLCVYVLNVYTVFKGCHTDILQNLIDVSQILIADVTAETWHRRIEFMK